jgi:hypothetical protein
LLILSALSLRYIDGRIKSAECLKVGIQNIWLMRLLLVVIAMIISAILAISFAVLDEGYACPTGQAPVIGADGKPMNDASGTPICKPIDAFNNLFGK